MTAKLNRSTEINLASLLETRLLVQANSGGGKSWALRRLLEQTANQVQQIVIDPEGEFASLREKFDYVICAPHDGDAIVSPQTAKLLARRLLETGVSAIIDIYDLKAYERQTFVRIFCQTLVDAPKKLWHPCLIVLDEAHVYAPEKGKSESTGSVIDLATRGRKRGYCLAVATQRLAKLHKDVAAEMNNKMIGRTGLDVDIRRAADELGITHKDAVGKLRNLDAGEWFVFGPAISRAVTKIKVGPVRTTHPKAGSRMLKPPPAPSARVKKALAKLADLPKDAEEEARTFEAMSQELKKLKRQLRAAQGQDEAFTREEVARQVRDAKAEYQGQIRDLQTANRTTTSMAKKLEDGLGKIRAISEQLTADSVVITPVQNMKAIKIIDPKPGGISYADTTIKLRSGAIKILRELVARFPAGYSKPQVGTLTGFAHKGGTFSTYLSDLRRSGFIEERDGLIFATQDGAEQLGEDISFAPTSHEEVMEMWGRSLRSGAFKMLRVIVGAGEQGIDRINIALQVGMEPTGGTFSTYLSDLRRNGLITESNKVSRANDILFP